MDDFFLPWFDSSTLMNFIKGDGKFHHLTGDGTFHHVTGIYVPGTQMTFIFEGQSLKTMPFTSKTRVIWVLGLFVRLFFQNSSLGLAKKNKTCRELMSKFC